METIRGERAIILLGTTSPCRAYVTTTKAMQFNEDFPALPIEGFQNHYLDLTSLQHAGEQLHYPEFSGESLSLGKMIFPISLGASIASYQLKLW